MELPDADEGNDQATKAMSTMSLDQQLDEQEEPAPSKKKSKHAPTTKVTIKRTERNKRKHITSIANMDLFDVDLKKAAKLFANKFACGASVTKSVSLMKDEIVIQGDVQEEVCQLIISTWPQITMKQISILEPKVKKKAEPPLPPPQ